MTDPSRTIQELLEEISILKQRIQELEHSESERKQTESKREAALKLLRESEVKYRLIAENTADLISILDMNLRFTYVSPASVRLRGFTVEEAMEQTLEQVLTPESMRLGPTVFEKEMQLEASGTADSYRTRILELEEYKKDGSIVWVEVSLSFLRDKDRKPVEILMVSRDITERKRAEEALQESEARFRNLLQDVQSVSVQGYGLDGTTQYWNQASELLYGYSTREALCRNLLDLIIPPEMRVDVAQAIQQMAETGQPIPAAELSLMRKDGSRVSVYSSHAIVQIPGHAPELFCIDIDITERKQAEEEKRRLEERLQRADKTEAISTLPDGIALDW